MFKKNLLFLFFLFIGATGSIYAQFDIPKIPEKQTSVYDYVNLLSSSKKNALEQKLIRYSDSTSTQIVVVVISSTKGENIGLLTPRWAHKWGIGQEKEDNGVFILLAKDDRNIWISPGYGVEHKLTAGTLGEITRKIIIPEFKKGDYYSGLDKASDAIFEVLSGTYKASPKNTSGDFPFGIIVFLLFIFVIFIIIISASNKRGGKGGGKRKKDTSLLEAIILSNMGRGSYSRRSSSGWSGGGWSSGGSSGGFGGGFGGGGFSGGGAGGSW